MFPVQLAANVFLFISLLHLHLPLSIAHRPLRLPTKPAFHAVKPCPHAVDFTIESSTSMSGMSPADIDIGDGLLSQLAHRPLPVPIKPSGQPTVEFAADPTSTQPDLMAAAAHVDFRTVAELVAKEAADLLMDESTADEAEALAEIAEQSAEFQARRVDKPTSETAVRASADELEVAKNPVASEPAVGGSASGTSRIDANIAEMDEFDLAMLEEEILTWMDDYEIESPTRPAAQSAPDVQDLAGADGEEYSTSSTSQPSLTGSTRPDNDPEVGYSGYDEQDPDEEIPDYTAQASMPGVSVFASLDNPQSGDQLSFPAASYDDKDVEFADYVDGVDTVADDSMSDDYIGEDSSAGPEQAAQGGSKNAILLPRQPVATRKLRQFTAGSKPSTTSSTTSSTTTSNKLKGAMGRLAKRNKELSSGGGKAAWLSGILQRKVSKGEARRAGRSVGLRKGSGGGFLQRKGQGVAGWDPASYSSYLAGLGVSNTIADGAALMAAGFDR